MRVESPDRVANKQRRPQIEANSFEIFVTAHHEHLNDPEVSDTH